MRHDQLQDVHPDVSAWNSIVLPAALQLKRFHLVESEGLRQQDGVLSLYLHLGSVMTHCPVF